MKATWRSTPAPAAAELTEHRLSAPGGARLDKVIALAVSALSRSRVRQLIDEGQVRVDGAVARKASARPPAGAAIAVTVPPPRPARPAAQDIPLEILYQDASLAVLVKPAGLVVHPAPGHPDGTLVNALLHHLDDLSGVGGDARPGIVHRLDKGTSGVMVVAKGDAAHRSLQAQFAAHSIERRYRALVLGSPDLDAGRRVSHLGRHPRDRLRFASVERGGKRAVTHWRALERLGPVTLVECQLETGRTHQIRVHMAEAGWPVLGDPHYARGRNPPPAVARLLQGVDHQLLHAQVLGFEHPATGAQLRLEASPPADFRVTLMELRAAYGGGQQAR